MRNLYVQRYLITGLLTFIPLWLTWLVFKFIFSFLSEVSTPWVAALSAGLSSEFPGAAGWLNHMWLQSILAFISTIVALYVIGFASNRVIGQRLISALDNLMSRIPLVHSIYGGTKKLMSLMQNKPTGTQRVVLINFPSPELKSIGFVTRVFQDNAGRDLAAVYVPTTPNPTGGYLEIVPLDKLIAVDWSVDQAMAFLLSGGAIGPDTLPFSVPREPLANMPSE
ncbi:DUF502 domain-containing protein [Pseudolysobacter antarcticus]|uniref:DUF502 domain-containing protein n=1 Tax=Pseudolysobacter antarcticus TaxID=2511995 RepID=A0A411HHK8_9GAMM|nr:DUF502 domain-containing protein [Pseudolysobacter antarcticus]QBB69983.1 DUF502 domain-containing protein [Pseudolysobacter antarcticus]